MIIALCILIIISIAFIALIALSGNFAEKLKTILSFEDFFSTGMSIVPLYNNNKKFYFIVDTGSSNCVLNKKMLDKFVYEKLNTSGSVYGIEGNTVETESVKLELSTKNHTMSDDFLVLDIPAFDNMSRQHNNIQIAGILGGTFLSKYGFIVDYKTLSLKVYQK